MAQTKSAERSFPTDFLREVIDTSKKYPHGGEPADEADGATREEIATYKGAYLVSNEEAGTSRWANNYDAVFVLPDGTFWRTSYRRGTGDEAERPYEHSGPREDCVQVEPYEVTVTRYRAVEAPTG